MKPQNHCLMLTAVCGAVLLFTPHGYAAGRVTGFEPGDPAITGSAGDASVQGTFQGIAAPDPTHQFLITTISATDGDMLSPVSGTNAVLNSALQTFFNGTALLGQEGAGFLVPFTVTAGDQFLTFNYDFLTNEFGTGFHNDFGFYAIFSGTTNVSSGAHNFIDAASAQSLLGPVPDANGPFGLHTGDRSYGIPVASLAPGNYTLGIGIEDATNRQNASGLLVDNIQVAAVPEPSVVGLTIAGAILLVAVRRRMKGA